MPTHLPTRPAKAVRIFCPVDAATLNLVQDGRFADLDPNTALSAIMAVVRADNPLGDFGIYKAVLAVSTAWELFTPGTDATPTLGASGRATISPTVLLTIYVPAEAPADSIADAVSAIMAAHPWETPIVELTDTLLVVRG